MYERHKIHVIFLMLQNESCFVFLFVSTNDGTSYNSQY